MEISDTEKVALDSFEKIKPQAEDVGCEVMDSVFQNHPDTKSHFSHMDVSPGSPDLKTRGGKIINAINDALSHHGNLDENLAKLQEMYTNELNLNVDTIKLLSCLLEVIVKHFPNEDKSACDKFLNAVVLALISK